MVKKWVGIAMLFAFYLFYTIRLVIPEFADSMIITPLIIVTALITYFIIRLISYRVIKKYKKISFFFIPFIVVSIILIPILYYLFSITPGWDALVYLAFIMLVLIMDFHAIAYYLIYYDSALKIIIKEELENQ